MNEIVTLVSIAIALIAVLLTLWQNFLTRKTLQAQALLTLRELANEASYQEGLAVIVNLKKYTSLEEFKKSLSPKKQKLIFDTVDFLNFAAHMVEEKVLPEQMVWNFYFWAYRTSNEKLLDWYLIGHRRNFHRRFQSFERMCKRIGNVSDEEIIKYEKKLYGKNYNPGI